KLDEALTQTINARLFYEKYKSLLDEAKQIHQEKYAPLWSEIYNNEATTSEEQEQLRQLEEIMKNAWGKLEKAINELFKGKIDTYLQEYPKSKTLKRIKSHNKKALNSSNDQEVFKLVVRLAYHLDTIVNISKYVKNEEEKKYWLEIPKELFENTIGAKGFWLVPVPGQVRRTSQG
ncbi:5920_t:CDS:2, partial [Funneliformis geosporum]